MPQMDGLEATRWITQQWLPESRPWIIAMTAHAMLGDRQECLNAGMNDYISKPLRVEALVQALNSYKRLHRSAIKAGVNTHVDKFVNNDKVSPSETGNGKIVAPAIDLQVLQGLRDIAGEAAASVLAEIIQSYLNDAPLRLQAINQAVVLSDAIALQKSAHAFRSLSVIVGAVPVAQLCEALEAIGRAGTTVSAKTLVKQLQAEYKRLEAALQLEH